jgi:hypothetical protein
LSAFLFDNEKALVLFRKGVWFPELGKEILDSLESDETDAFFVAGTTQRKPS